ncbi:MAG: ABC transporter ATP-binding protein [Lachnospiraceae bacterium]|nr:ABC transporter ATP-binding protein [Lachnospiraceae bacterium]MDY5742443.1 ABC transporter ATP-binding protein [Lachnospiraceae bacterium]
MEHILECSQLVKDYSSTKALDGINVKLDRGRIIGLVGPNGSGKTTLIKIATGLLEPTSGELRINGMLPGVETKKIVSYLPDCNYLNSWMTVRQLVDYFADFYQDFKRDTAREMLLQLGLDEGRRLKTLSKGNKEKVQLILTMSRTASLYILDEPIAGVDPVAREYILRTILNNYERNATILISTHLISEIENILDDVLFLKQGRLVLGGSVEDIRMRHHCSIDHLFREVFRCF